MLQDIEAPHEMQNMWVVGTTATEYHTEQQVSTAEHLPDTLEVDLVTVITLGMRTEGIAMTDGSRDIHREATDIPVETGI